MCSDEGGTVCNVSTYDLRLANCAPLGGESVVTEGFTAWCRDLSLHQWPVSDLYLTGAKISQGKVSIWALEMVAATLVSPGLYGPRARLFLGDSAMECISSLAEAANNPHASETFGTRGLVKNMLKL